VQEFILHILVNNGVSADFLKIDLARVDERDETKTSSSDELLKDTSTMLKQVLYFYQLTFFKHKRLFSAIMPTLFILFTYLSLAVLRNTFNLCILG